MHAQFLALVDHLVVEQLHLVGYTQPLRCRGQIDHPLELARLFNRQIRRLGPFKDPVAS